jgi:hypothetical protein
VQKGRDVRYVLRAQHRRVARLATEGRLVVEIGLVALGQVVGAAHPAPAIDRVELGGPRVALRIEAHRILQARHRAVVEEHLAGGHIAQRGGLEEAAELGLAGQVLPQRAAPAQVAVTRVVGRDGRVARYAQCDVAQVGEQRKAPRLMPLGWQLAQLPLLASLNSARPRASAGLSAVRLRR